MKVNYVVIQLDDSVDHVISTNSKSLKAVHRLITHCRKDDPDGSFIIAKVVETKHKPRRWKLL